MPSLARKLRNWFNLKSAAVGAKPLDVLARLVFDSHLGASSYVQGLNPERAQVIINEGGNLAPTTVPRDVHGRHVCVHWPDKCC